MRVRLAMLLGSGLALVGSVGTGAAAVSYTTRAERAVENAAVRKYRLDRDGTFVSCIRSFSSNSRFTCPWAGSTGSGSSWDGTAKVKIVNGRARVLTLGTKP